MKHALFSLCLLLALATKAEAHIQPPITGYVQFSDTVCIAQATAISNGVITFTVKEIIKGQPPAILTLHVAFVPEPITLNSEWLLASTGRKQDTVGWANKGDFGWVNAPVKRVDGQIRLVGNYGRIDPTLAADPSKGLTLEQLQILAKTPIPKH